jgi:uncharacterized protein with PIN domain
VFISHDHVQDQLQELTSFLDLKHEPFIRCSRCNTLLVDRPRDEVKGHVSDYVYETHENFAGCPLCGRIYWKGTHIPRIYDMIHLVEEGLNHDQACVR